MTDVLCIILHEWPLSQTVRPVCMSFHKVDVNTLEGVGLFGEDSHMLSPLTSQCHEVSVESVHIPFIWPIAIPRPKYPHPPLPAPQPPSLWSVSCFQILNEVEDINSEGSYGGGEPAANVGHRWACSRNERTLYTFWQFLKAINLFDTTVVLLQESYINTLISSVKITAILVILHERLSVCFALFHLCSTQ